MPMSRQPRSDARVREQRLFNAFRPNVISLDHLSRLQCSSNNRSWSPWRLKSGHIDLHGHGEQLPPSPSERSAFFRGASCTPSTRPKPTVWTGFWRYSTAGKTKVRGNVDSSPFPTTSVCTQAFTQSLIPVLTILTAIQIG